MESITSLKNAATRAIWGDEQSHQEPISGQTGDVAKGEPYDAGNMEPSEAKAKFTAPDETGTQPVETEYSKPEESEAEPVSKAEPETKLETESRPKPEPKLEPETKPQPTPTPQVNPIELKGSSNVHGDSTKAQNDVRDPTDPSTHHENAVAKENVDDSGEGLDIDNNPDKINGPGPRPLEQVAKENGGDAGKNGSNEHVGSHSKLAGKKDTESNDGHRNSGTGELYVKSSGLVADGGDFDASAPGAGREADRLLEEKGVHREDANHGLVPNDNANGHNNGHANGTPKEKTSLKSKIKAKLHRNSVTAA